MPCINCLPARSVKHRRQHGMEGHVIWNAAQRAHGPLSHTPPLRRAARIFFWLAIIAAALLAVHVGAVLVCRVKALGAPPRALEVPRMELWVALAVLQPFSQACGRAFAADLLSERTPTYCHPSAPSLAMVLSLSTFCALLAVPLMPNLTADLC